MRPLTFPRVGAALLAAAVFLFARGAHAADAPPNVLWDGGFDTGFGNGFWTALNKNLGPSRRDTWSGEAITLRLGIGSRVYPLADGEYTLCAWVKRNPAAKEEEPTLSLELTNGNYYRDKKVNSYERKFPVAAGADWQRVGWSFKVAGSVRPLYHVELRGGPGVMVDAVSLTPGTAMPAKPNFAADVEAGFDVGEETRVYLDGEPRTVDLMVANHGPAAKARVKWALYDFREDLVKEGTVEETFPAGAVTRRRLPLEGLPHGGYRLASSVDGQPVLGDALVAFLPKVDAKAFPWLGLEPCFQREAIPFTPRMLNRLGILEANILSCSGNFARWGLVEAKKGEFAWQDFMAEAGVGAGIEMIPYMSMTYEAPPWTRELLGAPDKRYEGFAVADEKGFSEAYCRYVDAFVRRYSPKGIRWFMIDDEIHGKFPPSHMDQFVRLYCAAYDTAKKAGADAGVKVLVGINATTPEWWDAFLAKVPRDKVDMISSNTAHRPGSAAAVLNVARARGFFPEIYHTGGVGQKSPMRRTSLISDHGGGAGFPSGTFAWQAMLHAWLSRPYGTEDPKDGPLAHLGFYDARTLAQCAYLPFAGKTGVEFDNSPSVGWQSLTILKSLMPGMRPVRDAAQPFSIQGLPTGSEGTFLYAFRDAARAVVVVSPAEEGLLDRSCRLRGADLRALSPADLYGNPIAVDADGSLLAREFPIYLRAPAAALPQALAALQGLKAEPIARAERHRLEAGDYALEVDPASEGYFRLWRGQGEKRQLLLDRLVAVPPLEKPSVQVVAGRIASSASLSFGKQAGLTLKLSPEGCEVAWAWRNTLVKEIRQKVRLRVASGGAGRRVVIQEGDAVRSGKLREDYGAFAADAAPPAPEKLAPGAARVVLEGFMRGDLPPAAGRGFSPATGFLWKAEDGQAFLEAAYALQPYAGGGARGTQYIELTAFIK
jgi:hypothetical protein